MRNQLFAGRATGAVLFGFAMPSHALLMLSSNINGTTVNCADGQACDTNPNPNQLAIADQTVNGVQFLGSSQTANIGATNSLDTSSFQFINTNPTPATVTLAVSQTGFLGPVVAFSSSGSGTWKNCPPGGACSITMGYFGDATNTQGANNPADLPGTLLDTFSNSATLNPDSFSHSDSGVFFAAGDHSLSLSTAGTLAAWNGVPTQEPSLVGRSQAIVTEPIGVFEPGTLAMLGTALVGFGLSHRWMRRRKSDDAYS